jgi:hypothetical protein
MVCRDSQTRFADDLFPIRGHHLHRRAATQYRDSDGDLELAEARKGEKQGCGHSRFHAHTLYSEESQGRTPMPADDLGVVARFAVEVLEQGHLEVLDELVDSSSEAVNWEEFRDLLATIKDEAPGLGLHIGGLDEHDGLVTGTLHLSIPVGLRVSGGRISAVELPEYLLPGSPAAADSGPAGDRGRGCSGCESAVPGQSQTPVGVVAGSSQCPSIVRSRRPRTL